MVTVNAAVPATEYLPPSDVLNVNPLELQDLSDTVALSDDGYRYKTVRKFKYRHRRDVSELPSAEYLPPADEYIPPAEESAPLADDGYRYKTVRKYRHRRDANNIPIPFPSNFDFAAHYPEEAGVTPTDGYKYRTIKRFFIRKRRAAIDLPTGEYLPPAEEAYPEASTVEEEAPAHELAADGYHYKTVRKLKYRNRRDVDEALEA